MKKFRYVAAATLAAGLGVAAASAQSNSGVVTGTVKDPSGAIVPGASVVLEYTVSGYVRNAITDAAGQFRFFNVPFNPYRITVRQANFSPSVQDVTLSSSIPVTLPITLTIAGSATSVDVETSADLSENDPHFHTDIDRSTMDRLPIESPSSALSSIVSQLSPGIAADSNGLLHGLGDHNEVSFSLDGQPITDQQSKVFSNQVPASAIQSMEVVEGAPPAEYGDKTSIVVVATTRSGQGVSHPTGTIAASYGSFGSSNLDLNLATGTATFGNFFAGNVMQSGRFLDTPEFIAYHDKGNEENLFDRIDQQLSDTSSLHLNMQYTRSWFQTPNSYDTQFNFRQSGATPGATDQKSKIETFNISPTYTRSLGEKGVLNFAPSIRRDSYNYYPSNNLLADLGPIQQESVAQQRSLTNAGVHADVTYVTGHHNVKVGGMYQNTFLRENNQIGLVDPALNALCTNASGKPSNNAAQCADPAATANTGYNPILAPYDLTNGGSVYSYHGQTAVKQLALYAQDAMTLGNFQLNLGLRGDFYNGLSIDRQAEPRAGLSYRFKKTGTVLRTSYARTQETPFNENLVLSSRGCLDQVVQAIFQTLGTCNPAPFRPGFRNEIHAGLSQSVGKHFVLSGDYITKYTHNAYDFSVFGATPITFPIEWKNSKIPGFTLSGTLTEVKGLSGRVTMSSVAARFFNPQVGGVGTTVGAAPGLPFRIDHDERFNQTTHLEYKMPFRKSTYLAFNWKLDSGLVAAATPCYNATNPNSGCAAYSLDSNGNPLTVNGRPAINLSSLTSDEQFQAGLACNGVNATQTSGFSICNAAGLTSKLLTIPTPGTEDDDHKPSRVAPRNLFDIAMGDDRILHSKDERYALGARITAINVMNKYALYNFLSTFSGTHYVTPRSITGEVAFHF
ncbi:MAG: TonB-dependent receptor [Janthinobacterium lividum]